MSGLFLIVGLGNSGSQYIQTRHNAGFWFMDTLLKETGSGLRVQSKLAAEVCRSRLFGRDCILAKPTTFMNLSGQPVRAVMDYYRVHAGNVLIAYDELDLPVGTARLKLGGGHGGHNGMRNIFQHLGDTDFMRLRIGIGHPGHKDAVTAYVLSRPPADQQQAIMHSIGDAMDVMPDLLGGKVAKAIKELHTDRQDQDGDQGLDNNPG